MFDWFKPIKLYLNQSWCLFLICVLLLYFSNATLDALHHTIKICLHFSKRYCKELFWFLDESKFQTIWSKKLELYYWSKVTSIQKCYSRGYCVTTYDISTFQFFYWLRYLVKSLFVTLWFNKILSIMKPLLLIFD